MRVSSKNLEIHEINRGSPSFRLNSIEREIEILIRAMVQYSPMKKQEIQNKLSQYSKADVAHVIKHSKGLWCDLNNIVEYRDWVQPDSNMDVGV